MSIIPPAAVSSCDCAETDSGPGAGAGGKWTDAATGQHGDLHRPDRRHARQLTTWRDTLGRGATLPQSFHNPTSLPKPRRLEPAPSRIASKPRGGCGPCRDRSGSTLAETYLRGRGITDRTGLHEPAFSPAMLLSGRTTHQPDDERALMAGSDRRSDRPWGGEITGVHRTWLAGELADAKAPVVDAEARPGRPSRPRRAVRPRGRGHGCWRGHRDNPVVAMRFAPDLPLVAALSANSPRGADPARLDLRRLYIARDNDDGRAAGRQTL